jgi:DNA replication protein DnaC
MDVFDARQSPRWLTLMGASDTGKTHCASRVFRHLNERSDNHRTKWTPGKVFWPQFVLRLRDPESHARQRLFDLMTWPVLFLDDIGAERDTTGFATEQLNALLGMRVGRWTILTSNLSLRQIAQVEPRIATRIVREPGNLYVVVTAGSYSLRRLKLARATAPQPANPSTAETI